MVQMPALQIVAAAVLAACLWAGAAAADSRICHSHVVRPGETLRMIAALYLGDRNRSGEIHAANRDRVGSNPDVIAPGLQLSIPCDTAGSAAREPAQAAEMAATAADAMAPAQPGPEQEEQEQEQERLEETDPGTATGPPAIRVDVLTGAPFLPFVDPADPSGGLITELVLAAFSATPGPPVEISFVNDRPAHLDILLPRGGFAFSFPWLMPDCAEPGRADTPICRGFARSSSLYEHVTEFYTLAGSAYAAATRPADIAGARLCRPEGHPIRDLAEMGLLPDGLTMIRPPAPSDCLAALRAGEADIASLDAGIARRIVRDRMLDTPIVALERLTRIEQMRALAVTGDSAGEAAIARLSDGLQILADSGEWFAIVERHLESMGN